MLFPLIFANFVGFSLYREKQVHAMQITKDTLVRLTYTLRYDKADGDIIESFDEKKALDIVMGHGVLFPVLEEKIMGLKAGDTFSLNLTPQEAYGEYDEEKVVRRPKVELLEGLPEEAAENIFEGNILQIVVDNEETHETMVMNAMVVEIKDDIVTLDFNHPLTGENLFFEGKILSVRPATAEEIKAAEEDEDDDDIQDEDIEDDQAEA